MICVLVRFTWSSVQCDSNLFILNGVKSHPFWKRTALVTKEHAIRGGCTFPLKRSWQSVWCFLLRNDFIFSLLTSLFLLGKTSFESLWGRDCSVSFPETHFRPITSDCCALRLHCPKSPADCLTQALGKTAAYLRSQGVYFRRPT